VLVSAIIFYSSIAQNWDIPVLIDIKDAKTRESNQKSNNMVYLNRSQTYYANISRYANNLTLEIDLMQVKNSLNELEFKDPITF
jgi:hypothetical protein